MITLLIIIVVIFLIWVLFVSNFNRQKRIAIAAVAVVVGALVVWFEGYGERPRDGLIDVSDIAICGVEGRHSYRSNFKVAVCLKNQSTEARVQRITVSVLAESCDTESTCQALETVERDVLFDLAPGSERRLEQSLDFKSLRSDSPDLRWSATVQRVQAIK